MTALLDSSRAADSGNVAIMTTPAAYGGLEKVTVELVRGLHRVGRRTLLVAVLDFGTLEPAWISELRDNGADIVVLRIGGRDYLGEYRAIRRILAESNIGVVHTHGYRADLIHARAARSLGIATVSTVHGFTGKGTKGRLYEWLQCRALRWFDAVVPVSRPLVERLIDSGVPSTKLHLIPNGMPSVRDDFVSRAAARKALGLPPTGTIVGWVGRVSGEKGPDIVIKSMEHLPSTIALCLVGDGPELANTQTLAASLNLASRVHFAGAVPNASQLFLAFDLLALSSRTEGTPMVLMEAAAARVPIIATAVGGVPDLIGLNGGWLVPSEDPNALGKAMRHALDNPIEASARTSQLLSQLQLRASADEWIDRYDQLYRAVSARGASGQPQT